MRTPPKPTLEQRISGILLQLQTRWERLTKSQLAQWTAYADYLLLSQSDICTDALNASLLPTETSAKVGASYLLPFTSYPYSPRQLFILQNFYRTFYGPLNGLSKDPVMYTPIFAPSETMEVWGPKGEWSNKDIIRYPFPLDIKKHIAIIWESPPLPSEALAKDGPLPAERGLSPLPLGGAGGGLMLFTTLNGRDQDTTIPYREQFGNIPKAGEYIFAKVGFANKLTGVVSNFVTLKQKVVSKP